MCSFTKFLFTNIQIQTKQDICCNVTRKIQYSTSVPGQTSTPSRCFPLIFDFPFPSSLVPNYTTFQTAYILIWTFGLWEGAKESFSFTESGSLPMKLKKTQHTHFFPDFSLCEILTFIKAKVLWSLEFRYLKKSQLPIPFCWNLWGWEIKSGTLLLSINWLKRYKCQ